MPTTASPAAKISPGEAVAQRTVSAYTLTPEQLRKSEGLHRTNVVLSLASTIFGLAVLVALVAVRFGPKVQRVAESISSKRLVQALIFVPALLLTIAFFQLPLDIYGHHISLAYGLSVQGWGSWLLDWAKAELLDPDLRHPHLVGPVHRHSPCPPAMVVLHLAAHLAHHGCRGLRRTGHHRPAV